MTRQLFIWTVILGLTVVTVSGQISDRKRLDSILIKTQNFLGTQYDSLKWIGIVHGIGYKDSVLFYNTSSFIGNALSSSDHYFFTKTKSVAILCRQHLGFMTISQCYFSNGNMLKYIHDSGIAVDSNTKEFTDQESWLKSHFNAILADTCIKVKKINLNDNSHIFINVFYCNDSIIRRIDYNKTEGWSKSIITYFFTDGELTSVSSNYEDDKIYLGRHEEYVFSGDKMTKWTIDGNPVDSKTKEFTDKEVSIQKRVEELLAIVKKKQ
jgi:hypothetical protein